MHLNTFLLISLALVSGHRVISYQLKRNHGSSENKEVLKTGGPLKGIAGSLQIALDYCKDKAIILKRPLANRHCIKRWTFKYNNYCVKKSPHVTPKCKRLKKKASKLHRQIIRIRLRGNSNSRRNNTTISCGERTISPLKYSCCAGKRFRLATHGCCGEIVYRQEKEACCNFHLHEIDGINKTRCCGDELIDVALFFCYNGTIKQKHSVAIKENRPTNSESLRRTINRTVILVATSSSLAVFITLFVLSMALRSSLIKSCSRKYLSVPLNSADYLSMPSTSESLNSVGNSKRVMITDAVRVIQVESSKIGSMSNVDTEDEGIVSDGQTKLANGLDNVCDERELLNNETSFSDEETSMNGRKNLFLEQEPSFKNNIQSLNSKDYDKCLKDSKVFFKEIDGAVKNVYVPHVDAAVQTTAEKRFNVLNSMGRPFDHSFVFNSDNKTLQLSNSAVTLTLSDDDVKQEKRCLASTHRNLSHVRKKLRLRDNEHVASPAIEYLFINGELKHFAKVTMPFVGDPSKLVVLKVKSDHGEKTDVETTEIKRKDALAGGSNEENYEIIGPGKLAVYVSSMSWLVCKYCDDKHRNFNLYARLYGRVDEDPEIPYTHEVSMSLYLLDDIFSIQDYLQILDENESSRTRLLWKRLQLPGEINMSDKIQVLLTLDNQGHEWKHRTNVNNQVISPEKKDILVDNITGCIAQQNASGLPFAKEWHLISTGNTSRNVPRLRCIVSTAHISGSTSDLSCDDSHYVDTRKMYDDFEKRNKEKKNYIPNNPPENPNDNDGLVCQPTSHFQQPESDMYVNSVVLRRAQQSRSVSDQVAEVQQQVHEQEHEAIRHTPPPQNDLNQVVEVRIQQPQSGSEQDGQLGIGHHRENAARGLNYHQGTADRRTNPERPQSDGAQNYQVRGEMHRISM